MSHRDLRRPVLTAAALAASGVLLLSACSDESDSSPSARQQQSFPAVYAQTVDWQACDDDFDLTAATRADLEGGGVDLDRIECAMVTAPLDWNDADNDETIELAVVHVPSRSAEPIGTMLGNPGGPGASGLEFMYGMLTSPGFDAVLDRYDMLGFDPRGIGRSSPVDCDSVSEVPEVQIALCADAHPLANTMGTSQAARDMELLRHLMGDDSMHYLGYSYGTMLGATYATLFPERVGRMVLDSASDARWAGLIGTFDQAAAIAEETVHLVSECGHDYAVPSCPVTDEPGLEQLYDRLDAEPLRASDGTEVDGEMIDGLLTMALYQGTAGRTRVLHALSRAMSGDQQAVDAIAAIMESGGAQIDLAGAIVRCHSFPTADTDIPGFLEHLNTVGVPELLGGPEVTDEVLSDYVDLGCDALPTAGDDIVDTFSGSDDAPILVIGITGDHATPYPGAQELTKELGNARLVTLTGHGHAASFTGRSTCIDEAATAYLLRGELPADGTVCADD